MLDRAEMAEILEEIIRDPDTNPTARCTAIRTLLEIAPAAQPISGFRGPPRGRAASQRERARRFVTPDTSSDAL